MGTPANIEPNSPVRDLGYGCAHSSRRLSRALACMVLLPAGLFAQHYTFKHYDQDSGLANQDVRALAQDRTGFLWIGTENGLYCYDEHNFRAFAKADVLPSSRIDALHVTPDGTLWVATTAGLSRLNGERFQAVDLSPARSAVAITSDGSGRLYVGASVGLFVSDAKGDGSHKAVFRLYKNGTSVSQAVRGIAAPESGPVW